MPGVKDCESRLCAAARAYSLNPDSGRDELKRAANAYGKAVKSARDRRDQWKYKKRMDGV